MSVDPPSLDKKQQQDTSAWGFALTIGWELAASVGGGFFLGQWLDEKLRTAPWLAVVGSLFGITVGLYLLIKAANERVKRGSGGR